MRGNRIKFTCFNCEVELEVPEGYEGRRGRCPKCLAKNTIPSSDDTVEDCIITLFEDMETHEEDQAHENNNINNDE